jgi:hypothetical protein
VNRLCPDRHPKKFVQKPTRACLSPRSAARVALSGVRQHPGGNVGTPLVPTASSPTEDFRKAQQKSDVRMASSSDRKNGPMTLP